MSTVLSAPGLKLSSLSRRLPFREWLREPLLHFIVLGGILFGADHFLTDRADDPHTIDVDAKVDQQARDVFKASRGREPNKEELYALRRVWLDNEVLYREGLAMQLDKGDTSIRERVIFKALSVVDAGTKLPPHDDSVLRAWFERNRVKYDEPARYDFQEAVLAPGATESDLRVLAGALNAGKQGNADAGLRVFKGRPHANLLQSYGKQFADALAASPVGEWRVLPSQDGLRVMRLEAITRPKSADFDDLRGVVLQDWTDATMSEQRSATVRALTKKYNVKIESSK